MKRSHFWSDLHVCRGASPDWVHGPLSSSSSSSSVREGEGAMCGKEGCVRRRSAAFCSKLPGLGSSH